MFSMYTAVNSTDKNFMSSYRHSFEIIILLFMSFIGFKLVKRMVASYRGEFLRSGFVGVDLNKPSRPSLPEAQGVLAGAVYLCIMFLFIPVPFWKYLFGTDSFFPFWANNVSQSTSDERLLLFKSQFIHYLAGLLSICCMVFLGFADDALDLPWRHKILMPSVASLPLLMVHLANEGTTRIIVPIMFRNSLGESIDIGVLYYIYMGLLAVFCTNSINIYAGINGLEVGQGLVIASSVMIFNLIELRSPLWRVHLFSLYFLIPFIFVCLALYKMNKFPAKVFVGDTFCYFAGMTLAVVGILGHFSKTLILFFVPQILNFLLSLPQILLLIPCPRHRLPQFSTTDSLLHPSCVRFHPKSLSRFGQSLLKVFTILGLVSCRNCPAYEAPDALKPEQSSAESSSSTQHRNKGDDNTTENTSPIPTKRLEEEVVEVTNFTLINAVLRFTGPMNEASTTSVLIFLQILCSCIAFLVRYPLAWYFYGVPSQ